MCGEGGKGSGGLGLPVTGGRARVGGTPHYGCVFSVGVGVTSRMRDGLGAKSVRGFIFTGHQPGINYGASYWQQGQLFRKLDIYLDLQ